VKIKIEPRWRTEGTGTDVGGLSERSGWAAPRVARTRTRVHRDQYSGSEQAHGDDNERDEILRDDARRVARLRSLVYELPVINM